MTTLVFTICARNYIGLSKVLRKSVKHHGPDVDFRIYVAEETEDESDDVISTPRALADFINAIEFSNMAFMYNVTEFCTALKAACFKHAFADGYDKCIYLDPDTFVVSDFAQISDTLDEGAILITPHLCLPAEGEGPRADSGILATGIYNLGFLGLRRCADVSAFLNWWHQRLRTQAFNDHYNALYTDQRWIDFVPSLFPAETVHIWRHLGCNVAPWNYHERRVEAHGDRFLVIPRQSAEITTAAPLIFLHFSGFNFRRILDGQFDQLNLTDAEAHADLTPVYERYGDAVREMSQEMAHYLSLPYAHDRFADGSQILPSHRRLFRVWRERYGDAAAPFAVGPGSFHDALKTRRLLAQSGKADLAADKASYRTIAEPEKLLARARSAFRLLFRALGRRRFFFLVRSLNKLANVEQHFDTFDLGRATIRLAQPKAMDLPE